MLIDKCTHMALEVRARHSEAPRTHTAQPRRPHSTAQTTALYARQSASMVCMDVCLVLKDVPGSCSGQVLYASMLTATGIPHARCDGAR